MHIFGGEKKEGRTIKNFPCQATGAEILRVACILLVENDIKIIASIHNAILIECNEEEADEIILKAQELMTEASTIVLGPVILLKRKLMSSDTLIDILILGEWRLGIGSLEL
jgi:hypothetical protein